jgi:GT2 family glycosyltransferase
VTSEIIVVDNASTDGTTEFVKEKYPGVILIENTANLGFAPAVNRGLGAAKYEFLFLLNQDTRIRNRAIVKLAEKMKNDSTLGSVGPKLIGFDGKLQKSCRKFPRYRDLLLEFAGLTTLFPESKLFGGWKMGWFDHETEREVDQPMGAALMTRRSVVAKVGNFDENLKFFLNDVDFCQRIKEAGYKNLFYPEAEVEHYYGGSIRKVKARMVIESHRAMFLYQKKYSRGIMGIPLLLFWGAVLLSSAWIRALWHTIKKK